MPELDIIESTHNEHSNLDRVAQDTRGRPLKIPTDIFIKNVAEQRVKSGPGSSLMPFGYEEFVYVDSVIQHGRDPAKDPYCTERLNYARTKLLDRLHVSGGRSESVTTLVGFRIVQEAKAMGYEINTNASLQQQAEQFLTSLDTSGLERYLRFHIQAEEERHEKFAERTDILKQRLVEIIKAAKLSGKLPESFNIEKAKERILQTEFQPSLDILWFSGRGSYGALCHQITTFDLGEDVTQEHGRSNHEIAGLAESILTHETVHSIAGMVTLQDSREEDEDNPGGFTTSKQGLKFTFIPRKEAVKKGRVAGRFEWLDEALTESIAISMLDKSMPTTRFEEINLYNLLRQKGAFDLPEKLFQEAYFEDFDTSAPVGQGLPEWNKLRHAINDAYDRQFLVELDDFILAHKVEGLNKAIEFLGSLDKGEYGLKNETLQAIRAEKATNLGLDPKATWQTIAEAESKD